MLRSLCKCTGMQLVGRRKGFVITVEVWWVSLETDWLLNAFKDLSPSFLRVQECCCLTPPEDLSSLRADRDHWISAVLSCYIMYCSKMPWDEIYTKLQRTESGWIMSAVSSFQLRQAQEQNLTLPIQLAAKYTNRSSPPFSQHWLDFMAHAHVAQRPSWSLGSNSIRWVKNGASTPLAELCWTCLSWKSLFAYFTIATEIWLIPGWGVTCRFLAHISKFA